MLFRLLLPTLACALAFGAVAVTIPQVAAAQDDGRVDVRVQVGYGDFVKRARWYPVLVTMRNRFHEEKDAYVTITRAESPNARPHEPRQPRLRLTQRVELPAPDSAGVPFPVHVYFTCPPLIGDREAAHFAVEIREGSPSGPTLLRSRRVEQRERDDGTTYNVIHWDPRAYATAQTQLTVREPAADRIYQLLSFSRGTLPVESSTLRDLGDNPFLLQDVEFHELPEHWLAYDGVDAVFLSNPEWESFDQAGRTQPLLDWVRSGGHLVLALSRDAVRLADARTRFDLWAGIRVLDSASLPPEPPFYVYNRHEMWPSTGVGVSLADSTEADQPMLRVEPREGTRVLARTTLEVPDGEGGTSSESVPLILEREVGLGRVTTFVFDPSAPALNAPDSSLGRYVQRYLFEQQWRAELFQDSDENLLTEREQLEELRDVPAWQLADEELHRSLPNAYSAQNEMRRAVTLGSAEIPFAALLLFLGLFVLVIGPLDYLLLGLINRRTWTWGTFSVAVIVFFVLAEFGTENLRGGNMSISQVAIHTWDAAGTVEHGEVFASAFPQGNADFEVWLERRNAHVNRMEAPTELDAEFIPTTRFGRADGPVSRGEQAPAQTPWDYNRDVVIAQPQQPGGRTRDGLYLAANPMTRWVTRHLQAGWLDVPGGGELRRGEAEATQQPADDAAEDAPARLQLAWSETQPGALTLRNRTGRDLEGLVLFYGSERLYVLDSEPPSSGVRHGEQLELPPVTEWERINPQRRTIYDARRERNNDTYGRPEEEVEPHPAQEYRLQRHPPYHTESLDAELGVVLLATRGDLERRAYWHAGRNQRERLQLDTLHRLDLSDALVRGAVVAVGWTSEQPQGEPETPLRVGEIDINYSHRDIYRVLLWPRD